MARIERSDGWPASGTVDTLQVALNAFFKKHKMRVIGKQVGEMHVRQGFPRLARWLHGHFMPQRWLPKRAMVRLNRGETGIAVRACIEETTSFRKLSPHLESKYRTYFDWWMDELRSQIR